MWAPIAVTAAAAAALGVLAAPAGIASADTSAQQTIADLQAQGYSVTIDRVGSKEMSACKVTGVRNPQTISQYLSPSNDRMPYTGPVKTIIRQSITVSLNCT